MIVEEGCDPRANDQRRWFSVDRVDGRWRRWIDPREVRRVRVAGAASAGDDEPRRRPHRRGAEPAPALRRCLAVHLEYRRGEADRRRIATKAADGADPRITRGAEGDDRAAERAAERADAREIE